MSTVIDGNELLADMLAEQIAKQIDDELIAFMLAMPLKEYVLPEEYQTIFTAIEYIKGIRE